MKQFPFTKFLNIFLVLTFLLTLVGVNASSADPGDTEYPLEGTTTTPLTTITVNSGTDPDVSESKTCLNSPECTLRRAVIQARNVPADQRPVLIAFNIPQTAEEGYNSTLGIWKIQFSGISVNAGGATLRYLNGKIIIDGSTQPDGRTTGPKIFLVGAGTGQNDGLKLGETSTQNENEILNLGFQNFKTHIYVNSASNLIQNNWFGLSDDGTGVSYRNSINPQTDGSGNTGISVMSNISYNVIRNNKFRGLAGVAAVINGNDTTFSNNYVGTNANGRVPGKLTDPSQLCSPVDWFGGSGFEIKGRRNLAENNLIAGIRINVMPPTIQADAIKVSGEDHIIRNNKIGITQNNIEVGVCGRGIYILGSTKRTLISGNQIFEPGLSAISLNDTPTVSTTDAITFRSNTIKKSTPWGEIEGNPTPEDAIQITKSLPTAFLNFKPAKVTTINGVNISGSSGDGSLCPNCIIEIFLDDDDGINEALQSLAVVTAKANGTWTATLPAALTNGQGLRTTSTTAAYGTIPNEGAGTTTGLSTLYTPVKLVYLPLTRR